MNSKCDYENVIGVDVAKAKLDIYQSHSGELRVIGNNAEAISLFAERIQASKMTTLVVMEGTGGYEALLADILIDHQIDCAIANPRQVRDFIVTVHQSHCRRGVYSNGFGSLSKRRKPHVSFRNGQALAQTAAAIRGLANDRRAMLS